MDTVVLHLSRLGADRIEVHSGAEVARAGFNATRAQEIAARFSAAATKGLGGEEWGEMCRQLGTWLAPGAVGEALEERLEALGSSGVLGVVVQTDDPLLAGLPWEAAVLVENSYRSAGFPPKLRPVAS